MKQPEFIHDTFEEYLGKKDYISASDIKNFLYSPKYYYYNRYEKKEKEDARHFAIGSAIHEIILEPHLFNQHYAVCPKVDRRTKDGKAAYENFLKENAGKTTIFEDEIDVIQGIGEEALKNKTLMELVSDCYKEISVYSVDEKTGLNVRMRPDALHKTKSKITDLKSCLSSSPKDFKNDVFKYGYSISAAFYSDFIGRQNYIFAALEKAPPYQISLFMLEDEKIEWGRQQYRMALDLMKYCFDNNYYPDYTEFELLKNQYMLENYSGFFEEKENYDKIILI
jgi:hypothetical protein